MKMNKIKKLCLIIIFLMILTGLLGPAIYRYQADQMIGQPLQSPSAEHILGTNRLGQDNFAALLNGFRLSIIIALIAGAASVSIGLIAAVIAAYYNGRIKDFILWIVDLFVIIPDIIMIMLFATFARPGIMNILFVMIFFSWSRVTKIIYSKVKAIMKQENIQYTILLKPGILNLTKKVWPDIKPAFISLFVRQAGRAVTYEATLSFIGIGDPTLKSWGQTIRRALDYEAIFWSDIYLWWLLPPLLALLIFILALSILIFDFDYYQKGET